MVLGAAGLCDVDVCADRDCTRIEVSRDASGESVALPSPLAPGVHFWRLRALGGTAFSPVWLFRVRARSAPVDTAWGVGSDFNGDGFDDVIERVGETDVVNIDRGGVGRVLAAPSLTRRLPQRTRGVARSAIHVSGRSGSDSTG